MANIDTTIALPASGDAVLDAYTGKKYMRWCEVGLVLAVAIGSSLFSAIHLLIIGPNPVVDSSALRWWSGTIHEITALLLLWYVLKRSGRGFADIGFKWSLRDVKVGLLVTLVGIGFFYFGAVLLYAGGYGIFGKIMSGPGARAFFPKASWPAVPFYLLNPFFEELIVRAYLMTEIRGLTGSATLATAISVGIQGSYHLYYGWTTALLLTFLFLVFALYFARWGRAMPVVVAHEFFDLMGLLGLR